VRGDQAEGCQSLPPGEAGQMLAHGLAGARLLRGLYAAAGLRSTPVLVVCTKGVADSTWPVARSITYT
jgi:hypothetical protein